ncbi:hypothetical protein B0H66DRAFT_540308 [Apodospora peruviana]|uniref:Uncharacterized protein n=1 Tax=Apodospora peruviana TaxID=516989 RepID=A0AAE0IPT2_9PEZI|nr:hypothetical protein B0H66DRAFT_540308 [Apodospora peruviana]
MGSNESTPIASGTNPTNHSSLETADTTPSPFICAAHNGYIPFEQSWEISDTCNLYCRQCAVGGRIMDPSPRVRGVFKTPGSFFGQNPALQLTCGKCRRQAGQPWALGWMFCLDDEVSFCKDCLTQDSSLLKSHRVDPRHTSSGKPPSWVLFTHPKADNDMAQLRATILNPQSTSHYAGSSQVVNNSQHVSGQSWVRRPANPPWSVLPNGSGVRNTTCDVYEQHKGGPTIGPTNSHWYACARCKPGWDRLSGAI